MAYWIIVGPEGGHHQLSTEGEAEPRVPEGHRLIRVPRPSHDPHCEHWDEARGIWMLDAEKRARIDIEAALLTATPKQIYDMLVPGIERLRARIDRLEAAAGEGPGSTSGRVRG